ncbi:hypothetical protein ANN_07643 [Periplaneta americana]|uniref:Uncharacterized protein n=1 Tax=Periplaneta americana TaxID=6978 RepID=A0ABQ8T0D8_PERAM|nr:hypothetical protein ANN_07643 [Periplaneta americana]
MAGLCEGGNEPSGSLKVSKKSKGEQQWQRKLLIEKGANSRISGKKLRKRVVKYFVWSVALYGAETWTLRRSEEKRLEAFEMWIWRRMERVKWTDRIRNEKEKKELVGSLAEKKLPTEECTGRNGERKKSSGQKKISDDRQHEDIWSICGY